MLSDSEAVRQNKNTLTDLVRNEAHEIRHSRPSAHAGAVMIVLYIYHQLVRLFFLLVVLRQRQLQRGRAKQRVEVRITVDGQGCQGRRLRRCVVTLLYFVTELVKGHGFESLSHY